MLAIGHRGAAGEVAENTLGSFRAALAAGADGVEFDVRELGGELIVLHDERVDRTTDGRGHYKDFSLAGLRALRTGNGEQIPFLHEVLALLQGCRVINVEVKEAGIGAQVVATLARWYAARYGVGAAARRALGRVLLSAFDPATSEVLARQRGAMGFGLLYEESFDQALVRARALGADAIHPPLRGLDGAKVAAAHAAGLGVHVYTVNRPRDIARCHGFGVDAVMSDYPARVVAFNRRLANPGEGE